MAWAKEVDKKVDPAIFVDSETNWSSAYPNSLDRWTKDFEAEGFKLSAEYDLGNKKTLYRFEKEGKFQNVIIESK